MRVLHTASHEKGQIYMPLVNWALAVGTMGAVIGFGSSDALGGAYGIAVSMLMAITTVLAALIALKWGYNPVAVAVVNGFFLVIDLIFVAANATKLIEGGWFPLLLAAFVAFLMLTWRTGWQLLETQRSTLRQREDEFVAWVLENPPLRLPGAAAIFTAGELGHPARPHAQHPAQSRAARARAAGLHDQHRRAACRSGPASDARADRRGHHAGPPAFRVHGEPRCHGGAETRLPRPRPEGHRPGTDHLLFPARHGGPDEARCPAWPMWRKALFASMHLNANLPAAYFGVPVSQVVEVGLEVEI